MPSINNSLNHILLQHSLQLQTEVLERFALILLSFLKYICADTQWCSWLRHWAASRKVTGSIPDGVIGIFHWHNSSDCTMALGLIQPRTELRTRIISWGVKVAGA